MSQQNRTTSECNALKNIKTVSSDADSSVRIFADAHTPESIHRLALRYSAVLRDPATPADLYNEVADEVTPLHENEGVKHSPEIDSVAYVERALLQRALAGLLDPAPLV